MGTNAFRQVQSLQREQEISTQIAEDLKIDSLYVPERATDFPENAGRGDRNVNCWAGCSLVIELSQNRR
jgi:hypothetical protein